ncbi:MAG: hypothetical protein COV29_00955 [Candidatus Yanofskybacteria bacterium CG10_big_fil_rev_8_21_14_0_10_36_16]|uniref:ComEC/Rec2-related protein domain-containing protein n=1 Tax=Candidatus Yanofskybacteria bacterium CG10_big_fil_rev_8_21_14_0_10_36_16 TaxID=1975096 RepID=A0A2J0Q8F4_9BACT|nr:MAG: hypothetical protein COV29_00955 [Candidatus Yanofskybacteria bacterium CG10_big_fil_rev_8_21_14_0_10_36_16]
MHKAHIFFAFLLAFMGGVFAGSFLDVSKILALWLMLPASIAVLIFWKRSWQVVLAGLMLIFFIGGVLRFDKVYSERSLLVNFRENVPLVQGRGYEEALFLRGYIDGEVNVKEDKQTFVFKVKQIEAGGRLALTNEKVLVTTNLYPQYEYGQGLEILGPPPKIPENFDGFDYRSYLKKDGIFTVSYYPEIKPLEVISPYGETEIYKNESFDLKNSLSFLEKIKLSLFEKIFKVKKSFEGAIVRSVAEPNASYIGGILLGSRSQIPSDLEDSFAKTGTTHILAISGYNITIIGAVVAGFFMLFMRRKKAFWLTVLGIIGFVVLTGAQASVVRAAIMGILILLARSAGRFYSVKNSIAFAGAVMVFVSPMVLKFDVGFQLSFMATLGLVYLVPILEPYFKKIPGKYALRETTVMTLSAQLMVLPLLIYYFKNISLVSLPANILILPLVPLNMFLGFVTGIAGMALEPLGYFVGTFAWGLSSVILGIIRLFAKLNFASIPATLNWVGVAVGYVLIVWFMVSKRRGRSTDIEIEKHRA